MASRSSALKPIPSLFLHPLLNVLLLCCRHAFWGGLQFILRGHLQRNPINDYAIWHNGTAICFGIPESITRVPVPHLIAMRFQTSVTLQDLLETLLLYLLRYRRGAGPRHENRTK